MDLLELTLIGVARQIVLATAFTALALGLLRVWRRKVLGFDLKEWINEHKNKSPFPVSIVVSSISLSIILGISNVISG